MLSSVIGCQRHNDKQALVHDLIPDLKVKEILYILNFGKIKTTTYWARLNFCKN